MHLILLWCSSKEDSLKDLQRLAGELFSKTKSAEETRNAQADNRKKQQSKEYNPNSNLSPLARFLLSRFVEVIILTFFLLITILKSSTSYVMVHFFITLVLSLYSHYTALNMLMNDLVLCLTDGKAKPPEI